ncbi:YggT family protein [Candidatus Peribacteria bacterium]|nr:MAG: YggT family protein [Candidatus Peribacteria bacterium]
MEPTHSSRTRPLYRGTQAVWYIVGILEALLAFRFLLKLLAANAQAGFTSFIYTVTAPFAAPFLNVFRISRVEGSVVEWTTILAMLVYWLLAYAVIKLLVIGKPVSTPEAAVKLDMQDK